MFQLEPITTKFEYEMGDESGYRYQIRTELVPGGRGHTASVMLKSFGHKTAQAAVAALAPAAEHFLEQVSQQGVELVDIEYIEQLRVAILALREYENGTAAPELAKETADYLENFLRLASRSIKRAQRQESVMSR
jgi:hypothetical protein